MLAQGGRVVIREEAVPELGPGDVLVRTAYSVVSPGTERAIIAATRDSVAGGHEYPHPGFEWPMVRSGAVRGPQRQPRQPPRDAASLGYSLAGIVERVGADVLDLRAGDRVACSGSQCAYHAERVVVPRSLTTPVPDGLALDVAAHVTLGAVAMEAFRRTECTLGATVVIVGTGMLGLLITQVARCAGVYAIAVDADPARLDLARQLGALACLPTADDAAVRQVRACTGGFGADASIIAAADRESVLLNFGFDVLHPGGRTVALGDFGMTIDRRRFFRAQATFVPSIAYGPGRYDPVYEENNVDLPISVVRWTESRNMTLFLRLLAEGRVDLAPFSPVEVAFEDAAEGYARLFGAGSPLTAVLRFPS
ncbi:MAG: zinc-dependent alcohol dehydrogenase [Chloroflexota bacterium]